MTVFGPEFGLGLRAAANHELSTWGVASKRTNNEREEARGQFLVARRRLSGRRLR